MVENFSWVTDKQVLNLPDDQVEEILGSIGLGVASNNADIIEEIKQTFKL
jgi:hypothetical protein